MPIVLAFTFGSVALVFLLILAVFIENPSPLLILVSRVILAMGCASVAAALPGFIDLELSPRTDIVIRAGGAMAVFVLVYLVNPGSQLILNTTDCSPPKDPKSEYMPVVDKWIEAVDTGELEKAYASAAEATRKDFKFETFKSTYENAYALLGKPKSRSLIGADSTQKLPDGQCGNFRILRYRTTFEKGDELPEIILLTVQDNRWVVLNHKFHKKD